MAKLLKDQIEKGLEYADLLLDFKYYKKHFWKHSCLYELARCYLGIDDPRADEKNRLLKKFLSSSDSVDSKLYMKLKELINEHNVVISKFFKVISDESEGDFYMEASIFKRTKRLAPAGALAFELQNI